MKEKKEERKLRNSTLGSRNCMNKVLKQETAECEQVRGVLMGTRQVEEPLALSVQLSGTPGSTYPELEEVATWISLAGGWSRNNWKGNFTMEAEGAFLGSSTAEWEETKEELSLRSERSRRALRAVS